MAHTRLFGRVRRALIAARRALPDAPPPQPRAISRRAALLLMAGTAAAACAPKNTAAKDTRPVAIIGGGTSGLVVAWRLAQKGVASAIYDSSSRTGGRMYTLRDFTPEGHFCELGGELVDSNHDKLIGLCGELGIEIQRLRPEGEVFSDVYDLGGKTYTVSDLLDPKAQTGAFIPVAARIAADQAALMDKDGNWTPRAHELDALPLSQYLESLKPSTDKWVIDLIGLAYFSEYGMALAEQSALNLVDFIGAETDKNFEMFGDSDESHRIAGGNMTLPETLTQRLTTSPSATPINLSHELASIAHGATGFTLNFNTKDGKKAVEAGRVVLALPFTRLRKIEGVGGLGLSADKMKAINELGYGANSKLMVATTSRPWQDSSILGLNKPISGTIYSDRGFQVVWDTSAGQPGTGGVMTNFMAGDLALSEDAAALANMQKGVRSLSPRLADALKPELHTSFFWPKHPHTLASYSAAKAGQYCGLFEHAAEPALDNTLFFAGEHTSIDGYGFMNGAVDAGERCAKEILAASGQA